ncbi:MAG: HEAT repeat domain-containing protein [Desulfarculus sp.]|nr:HEAT repeat domain-containing protein [Desulfarculus sp.]
MAQDLDTTILETLEKEDPNLVRAACILSGLRGLNQAERGLLKALGHKAWQVQAEAAKALGLIGSKGAVPYLRRVLKASDADLRQKMLTAAADTGKAAAEPGGDEAHPEARRAAAVALNRIEPAITQDALLAALGADQPALLGAAMAGLANLESPVGRERMVELLSHADPGVRKNAAACLGRLRETKALAGLLALVNDPDKEVRKEAAIALNHIKDRQGIGPLASLMDDGEAEVRRVAAIALGNTKSREPILVQALLRGLNDHEAAVRLASLSALANLRAAGALEQAAALLGDTHEAVARQAAVTVSALAMARERPDYDSD